MGYSYLKFDPTDNNRIKATHRTKLEMLPVPVDMAEYDPEDYPTGIRLNYTRWNTSTLVVEPIAPTKAMLLELAIAKFHRWNITRITHDEFVAQGETQAFIDAIAALRLTLYDAYKAALLAWYTA